MDSHNGLRPGSQQRSDSFGRKVLAIRVDVSQDRPCTSHGCATCRCNKCTARHDHFVARADSQTAKCQFKSYGAVGNSDAVFTTRLTGEFILELAALVSGPIVNLSRLENTDRRFDFIRLEMRPGIKALGADGLPTIH